MQLADHGISDWCKLPPQAWECHVINIFTIKNGHNLTGNAFYFNPDTVGW